MSLFKYQQWHLLSLVLLLTAIYYCIKLDSSLLVGELSGIDTPLWFWLAILSPILHQLYVWICWRLELLHNSITNTLGVTGFNLYKAGFTLLILSRLITITLLAMANKDTLQLSPMFSYLFASIISIPSIYLFYSVKKYFGMDRAFGIDHFDPATAKHTPFVKKGIFKYTSNGMYIYGFLILYIPGFIMFSKAALLVALFNHLYIWVHYYFTELPDIKYIYGE